LSESGTIEFKDLQDVILSELFNNQYVETNATHKYRKSNLNALFFDAMVPLLVYHQ
jgi:hypothetical protein